MIDTAFWSKRRVFVTGHTGFKGGWLSYWMSLLGAKVAGYALKPATKPAFFESVQLAEKLTANHIADVADLTTLTRALSDCAPDVVFHLAAQPLVRASYRDPVETYRTNVMGTAHLLQAVRECPSVRVVVVITTDKVYDNREWTWGYREVDALGGKDPYSSSKAATELVVNAWRHSFFHPEKHGTHGVVLASARAGNVIGGGDWSEDRLVPDAARALLAKEPIMVRNPRSTRPWQHVLEPLGGYLLLAQRCWNDASTGQAFNFGPDENDVVSVQKLVNYVIGCWGEGAQWVDASEANAPHEANLLKLDSSKARTLLGWCPRTDLERGVEMTVRWYQTFGETDAGKTNSNALKKLTEQQIAWWMNE